eukprot:5084887-Prymnesium_polylepis.2
MLAACFGYAEVVGVLLAECGEDEATRPRDDGMTPLHMAAVSGYVDVIQQLTESLNFQAALKMCSVRPPVRLPAHEAASVRVSDRVRVGVVFVSAARRSATDPCLALTGRSAWPQQHNYGEELWGTSVKMLVDAGRLRGDVPAGLSRQPTGISDRLEISGVTPLHITCDHGHTAGANELLSRGAEVDAPDSRGVTALMYASEDGQEATVRLLLRHQAKINLGDEDGTTALHLACRRALGPAPRTHCLSHSTRPAHAARAKANRSECAFGSLQIRPHRHGTHAARVER